MSATRPTAIDVSVLQECLIAIVREMRVNLMRTAFSSVIYESQDYSCALLDRRGQLVAQAEDNPSHIFPMPYSTRRILEEFRGSLRPGDVFMVNDPYVGGTHLNDVAIIAPLFAGDQISMIAAVRAHWGDVGGMYPGSLSGSATTIYQEGIRIPPLKVIDAGVVNHELLKLMLANMRVPSDRQGDFNAMLSTCHVAHRRLSVLIDKYTDELLDAVTQRILDDGEQQMIGGIRSLTPGEYLYENYLDSSGTSSRPLPIRLRLSVGNDRIEADFTGSAPQVAGPMNGGIAVAPTAVFVIVKSFLNPGTPVNEGAFRPVAVHAPEGSMLNAALPAACGGFSEVRRGVEAAVLGCLAQALPKGISGDTKGSANHCSISGTWRGKHYLFYEYPAGGTGGWNGGDGNSATRIFSEGDFSSIQPIESVENEHPLQVERCELRQDSGGDGQWRGGLGLRREVRVLAEGASLSVLSDRNVVPPFGVCGGHAGAPNRFVVRRGDEELLPSAIPGKASGFALKKGDVVVMESSGGGGYGDPRRRDTVLVERDLRFGYVSLARAKQVYGWSGERTADASEPLSYQMLRFVRATADEYIQGVRVLAMPASTAEAIGVATGDLVELIAPASAPLRGWVMVRDMEGGVALGPTGWSILGLTDTAPVAKLRRLRAIDAATRWM
jgi:N-methylhydantoinase B